jgi:hypothetical protein
MTTETNGNHLRQRLAKAVNSLHMRPGFLLWRAHHIAVSIFSDECRELSITPSQLAVLSVVKEVRGIDQMEARRGRSFWAGCASGRSGRRRGWFRRSPGRSSGR